MSDDLGNLGVFGQIVVGIFLLYFGCSGVTAFYRPEPTAEERRRNEEMLDRQAETPGLDSHSLGSLAIACGCVLAGAGLCIGVVIKVR